MPPAVAAIAGIAGIGLGSALGISWLTSLGVSMVLSAGAEALAPKPKNPVATEGRDRTQMVRQPISHHRIIYGQVRTSGPLTFIHSYQDATFYPATQYLHLLMTLAGHELQEIGDLYFDDELITLDGSGFAIGRWIGGNALVYKGLGATAGEATFNAQMRAGIAVGSYIGPWTTAHKQTGCGKLYVRFVWNPHLFVSSIPQVSVVVKGRKVWDPRDGAQSHSDPSTWLYSTNPALCILDYLAGYRLAADGTTRLRIGLGVPLSGIDTASFITAANICDEAVPLAGGGTEPRYTCNGSFVLDQTPKEILQQLLTSCGGKLVRTGGQWILLPASYRTPTVTLTESDLDGPIRVTTRISRREIYNAAKALYISPQHSWQPTDAPALTSAAFEAEDGERKYRPTMNLPFTTSGPMAQRLMKIDLLAARQQVTTVWPCKLKAFKTRSCDVVNLTNARMGWSAKPFEIVDWTLALRGEGETRRLGVDLLLRETTAAVYDWASSEEQTVDPAPNSDLPDPFDVPAPGAPGVTEELYETRSGAGVKAKAIVTWGGSSAAFLSDYQLEYKLSADAVWGVAGRTTDTAFELLDIVPGIYDFRVKALNTMGVASDYATSTNREIQGVLAPPANITGLTYSAAGGLAILRWDQHPDLDVRIGGAIEIRKSSAQSGASWSQSVSIGEAIPGSETVALLPLIPGSYLLKARDSSGGYSPSAAVVSSDGATVLAFTNVGTVQEDATFVGVHNGTFADGGVLALAGATPFDSLPGLIDDYSDWDGAGGMAASGVYTFASGMDLGAVKRVRLRTEIDAVAVLVNELFDDRPGLVDDWPDWDGTTTSAADCQVWVRTTPDNPSGSPTWSAWQRLDSGEFVCRGVDKAEARLTSQDDAFNIRVTKLRLYAEELV